MIHTWIGLLIFISSFAWAENSFKRQVTVEWEPIPDAATYEVELKRMPTPEDFTSEPIRNLTQTASLAIELKPGSYQMRVRARDRRKAPGAWSASQQVDVSLDPVVLLSPSQDERITAEKKDHEVTFRWKPVPGADLYALELISTDGKFKVSKSLHEPELKLVLAAGREFNWKVQALTSLGVSSGDPATDHFALWGAPLAAPAINVPENGYVRSLNWSRPESAETFQYALSRWNPEYNKWEKMTKADGVPGTQTGFQSEWPGGEYRLSVRAHAPYHESSEITRKEFKVAAGDRSPASEANSVLKQSFERTRGWFASVHYLLERARFEGTNADKSAAGPVETKNDGMSGRDLKLGAGYLENDDPLGFMTTFESNTLAFDLEIHNMQTINADAIFRNALWSRSEIRQFLGLGYHETLEIVTPSTATQTSTEKISTLGAHYGIEFWTALTSEIGVSRTLKLTCPSSGSFRPRVVK